MSIFKDVMSNIEKSSNSQENQRIPEGISFLDKNLSLTVLSVAEDGSFNITLFERESNEYSKHKIVLDKEHIFFIGKAMSEYLKNGNFNKLKSKVENFNGLI